LTLLFAAAHNAACLAGESPATGVLVFKKYAIYFAVRENVFAILAVFHASRNPAELEPATRMIGPRAFEPIVRNLEPITL
jgi:hypothetical protein